MFCLSYYTVFIVGALFARVFLNLGSFACIVVYSLFACAHVIFLRSLLHMFLLYVALHVCPFWMLFVQFYTEYCEHPFQTMSSTAFKSEHPYNLSLAPYSLNPAICS